MKYYVVCRHIIGIIHDFLYLDQVPVSSDLEDDLVETPRSRDYFGSSKGFTSTRSTAYPTSMYTNVIMIDLGKYHIILYSGMISLRKYGK